MPLFPDLDNKLAPPKAVKDYLINSEVLLPVGDSHKLARVLCWKHDFNGLPVGIMHKQPAMDTSAYDVNFLDGCTKELTANTIAEPLSTWTLMAIRMLYLTPS